MKLTELNVALRELKGNPKVRIRMNPEDEVGLTMTVEKSKLMAELKERFVERSAETKMYLTADGELKWVGT